MTNAVHPTGLRSGRREGPSLGIDDFSTRRCAALCGASRRACYNVPLRLAVRERLQEAGSSGVLPHGQHRAYRHWSLCPTTIFRIAYYVRSFIHAPASLTRATTCFLSLAFLSLPLLPARSLFLPRSPVLSPSREANPAILLAAWLTSADAPPVSGSLPARYRVFRARIFAPRPANGGGGGGGSSFLRLDFDSDRFSFIDLYFI